MPCRARTGRCKQKLWDMDVVVHLILHDDGKGGDSDCVVVR